MNISILGFILIALGLAVLVLLLIILFRTFTFPVEQADIPPMALPEVDGKNVAERIGLAVQYKTIANADQSKIDGIPFEGLHRLLQTLYPQVHAALTREVINEYSLLYTWEGKNKKLEPILFMAHQDVVPANEDPDSGWTHPPFSGAMADGYVWGRGTIDIKNSLIGIFEAVTALLKEGYQPERTVYLAFGHDEEVSGNNGARAIAQLLESRGVKLSYLLDEGGAVMQGFLPGITQPMALVGISEKGYLSLKLQSKVTGGHSSTPPANTAIGTLALSVAALEAAPFPAHLEVAQFLMSYLGKAIPFMQRMAFANPWLFGGMLKRKLAAAGVSNAIIRTTTAPTIIKGGHTENVLPPEAEAIINFRLLPGDTIKDVYEHVVDTVLPEYVTVLPAKGDTLEGIYGWNPTPVADTESPQFERMLNLVRAAFPEALAAPFLVVGATDARHYARICQNAFRFSPVMIDQQDFKGMHGVNERLSYENAARMTGFYIACMREMGSITEEYVAAPIAQAEPKTVKTKTAKSKKAQPAAVPAKPEKSARTDKAAAPRLKKGKLPKSDLVLPEYKEDELVVKPLKKDED